MLLIMKLFMTKYEDIYKPVNILNEIRINDGELFPCKSCNEKINIEKMKGAWKTNTCPYCGNNIYNT